ncbi:uncharacterized protein [Solanum tuberosum]|uniref:uncharacterized protein isoform X1 n=1 Tax=Solanum tuberosum TaxID=4113 RepID=UPI00073A2EAB|nr:PREDICTED: uncharacterized protein LOC102579810 isoform X1 [Solanum tuberosum]XP_015160161.1 PREDICTED: uncharacterized protein LOC102579810 isoform X1 [Solanum tuberosum]
MIQFLSASVMAIGSVVGFVGLELATSLLHSGYSLQPLERGFAALWRPHLFQYNISSLRDSGMHHFPSSVFICSFQLPITLIVSVHEENVNIHVAILFRTQRCSLQEIQAINLNNVDLQFTENALRVIVE